MGHLPLMGKDSVALGREFRLGPQCLWTGCSGKYHQCCNLTHNLIFPFFSSPPPSFFSGPGTWLAPNTYLINKNCLFYLLPQVLPQVSLLTPTSKFFTYSHKFYKSDSDCGWEKGARVWCEWLSQKHVLSVWGVPKLLEAFPHSIAVLFGFPLQGTLPGKVFLGTS